MNEIEIRVSLKPGPTANAPIIHAVIAIDGALVESEHVVDWEELFRTTRWSGEFFPWTGPNGDPLEVGIEDHVQVTREGNTVHWSWGSPASMADLAKHEDRPIREATFDAAAYGAAVSRGWWQACKLASGTPLSSILPKSFSKALLLKLPEWLETPEAAPYVPTYLPTPETTQ